MRNTLNKYEAYEPIPFVRYYNNSPGWDRAIENGHRMLLRGIRISLLLAATVEVGTLLTLETDGSSDWPTFVDVAESSGIGFLHRSSATSNKHLLETMGSGVALLDYDRDGLLDLYLLNGAELTPDMTPGTVPQKTTPEYWNRLYRNSGDWTFTDRTEVAGMMGRGYSMGVAVGDYDNDGWPDLYLTNFPSNQLFRNAGDGTFRETTETAGVRGGGWSSSAGFLDYDRDGDLDLFVCRYLQWDFDDISCGRPDLPAYCAPNRFPAIANLLYQNNGDGTFTDVTGGSGIGAHPSRGLGVAFNDWDGDGETDILVANDGVPQSLFVNTGKGTFREDALLKGLAFDEDGNTFAGMGVDFEDYDGDGWPDVLITTLSLETYALFRNLSGRTFDYISKRSGVSRATRLYSGWGTFFIDVDNDGQKDIFAAQGHVMDTVQSTNPTLSYLQPPLLLRNKGGLFVDTSSESGAPFDDSQAGRGAAFGDLDNDGDLDLVIVSLNRPVQVLRNESRGRNWINFRLVGRQSNREGIGSQIRITPVEGVHQFGRVSRASSYLSSSDVRSHFGLGDHPVLKQVRITWPSGAVQKLESVVVNQFLEIEEPGK